MVKIWGKPKARADQANPKVQEWERLTWKFQEALPEDEPGEKWLAVERVFKIAGHVVSRITRNATQPKILVISFSA